MRMLRRRELGPLDLVPLFMGKRYAEIEKFLKGLCSGPKPYVGEGVDKFIEILAGFIYERCDNMLANIENEELRRAILERPLLGARIMVRAYLYVLNISKPLPYGPSLG